MAFLRIWHNCIRNPRLLTKLHNPRQNGDKADHISDWKLARLATYVVAVIVGAVIVGAK